jgi:hypothetical protein
MSQSVVKKSTSLERDLRQERDPGQGSNSMHLGLSGHVALCANSEPPVAFLTDVSASYKTESVGRCDGGMIASI